ncbi:MAG: DUF3467 domain-containing protein [Planctomycetaceae bacterium]
MNDMESESNDDNPDQPPQNRDVVSQEVQNTHIGALVPESVAAGVFTTGAVVLNGPHEFILDFLLRMSKPQQVAARVVLPPAVVPRFIAALRDNLNNYTQRFGNPVMPGTPAHPMCPPATAEAYQQQLQQPQQQGSAQDLYEQLKIKDTELGGAYANAVMIGHTATEFLFDFITTFFPRSVVSARVYMAAPNVPRLLESLTHSFDQFQRKIAAAQQQQQEQRQRPLDDLL